MKLVIRLALLLLMLGSLGWAQAAGTQESAPKVPASGAPGRRAMSPQQHQKMMEMHKQHLAAMKADLAKMKA